MTKYPRFEDFYEDFFNACIARHGVQLRSWIEAFDRSKYANYGPYHTDNDCCFRELRDQCLNRQDYESLMDGLLVQHGCDAKEISEKVMLNADHILHFSAKNLSQMQPFLTGN